MPETQNIEYKSVWKELVEKFNVLKMSGASVGTYYEFV